MTRFRRVLLLVGLVSLASAVGGLGLDSDARAAAGARSNCAAMLTSFFGPQTLVDDAVHVLRSETAGPFGQLARSVAQTQGTLDECLALVGQPPAP